MNHKGKDDYTVESENGVIDINSEDLTSLDISRLSDVDYHIIQDGSSVLAKIKKVDLDTKQVSLEHNNRIYTYSIATSLDHHVTTIRKSSAQKNQDLTIKSSMPGLVLDVLVENGQDIEKGQPVMVLEAMKMENVIKSKFAGRIKKVHCVKGDAIDKNQLLIECETA